MTASRHPILNLADAAFEEHGHGERFAARLARLGPSIGAAGLGCTLTVVPPGKRAFPFHRHHVIEEMFFVVSGEGAYRHGQDTFPIRAGDLIAAPAGGEAHQIINSGADDLRYLAFSTKPTADVVDYPDSGKISVIAGIRDGDYRTSTYRERGRLTPLDYWDGEA